MNYFSKGHNRGKNLRPPDLYEYFIDNFWFKTVDLENQKLNEPLRGSHQADVVIIGGGFSGLSAAYHIQQKFPEKKILLLEGACCGYGASGRNGGFCISTSLIDWDETDPERRQQNRDVSLYGLNYIKKMIAEHDIDCDFSEKGILEVGLSEKQAQGLTKYCDTLNEFGFDTSYLEGEDLKAEIDSPLFLAGVKIAQGATLNPAKLVRGLKPVVESVGVEIRERTVVTRITPGKVHLIDTELGEVRAPILILATNAYSHKLGFFKDRVYPISVFQIATEPLSQAQWESIGWKNGQGLSDWRKLYSYSIPTADGRIVMGGCDFTYYDYDQLASGNDKKVTRNVEKDFFSFFPQLEGLKIDHNWGGTTAGTLDYTPSVGVTGDYKNIYYGTGHGEGVPSTQTSGRMIADLMAKESNEFTNHFIINRKIPYAGPLKLRGMFARGAKWMFSHGG